MICSDMIVVNAFIKKNVNRNGRTAWPWAAAEIFPGGGKYRKFSFASQVADDAMQMDVYKTHYPFYPISLCRSNLNSQSFV